MKEVVKGRIVRVLVMNAYGGNRSIAPLILNLGTPRPLQPGAH